MELVLPNNYVVIDEEEMMYLDGGAIYIPRRAITGAITGAAYAAYAALAAAGGGGLQLVLASYGLRSALVAGIVKGLGVLGIHIGNAFANTVIRSIASAGIGAGADWIFTNIIDGWDGRRDNQLRIG
ncbi:TPA: SPH_0218 family bacteriocin-like peptide [Streptococcus pneumoniae]|nr:SPH_0218 family bacteriocin-like peptide [Streptococcus pneumoniae]HET0945316.1 SPH_0218 family bacteriocin-like peptide [Streptococcus pneumoniae]HET1016243.1 SPH_0218 family bacteriocin-like peptide [Streptococcus pneumoniae]HET1131016.1 SPH_0218 family bacteriocin-like peptide [Streptococcus pneumoniae]HET1553472.1 SPH_0218 family bacteriocin-like peptide [Streptococcus pneumoniae]